MLETKIRGGVLQYTDSTVRHDAMIAHALVLAIIEIEASGERASVPDLCLRVDFYMKLWESKAKNAEQNQDVPNG